MTLSSFSHFPQESTSPSFAARLGWGAQDRVVIFHSDDVGMHHAMNRGAIEALEKGVVTSWSLMMPCPWIPEIADYLRRHPEVDAGLHLTLTSEWESYRWHPLAGKLSVPGLVDAQGAMWRTNAETVQNAGADEIEREIRAQIERAESLGIPITHLDSHMGTLFARPDFFERYVKVGIEKGIPILIAGGHLTHAAGRSSPALRSLVEAAAQRVWEAGLPVIDDIHTASYGWEPAEKTARFIELLRSLRPGITEVIVHCAVPTDDFPLVTDSSESRHGDLKALTDPSLLQVIQQEGIILTTWRELHRRRRLSSER